MSAHDHTTSIEYREIPEAPGYRFYADGSIQCCWTRGGGGDRSSRMDETRWHWLSTKPGWVRYARVQIKWNGKRTWFYVHELTLTAFHGYRPDGMVSRHINDDSRNNHTDNLTWGTQKENQEDMVRNGHSVPGERHPMAILTEQKVRDLRRLHAEGWSLRSLAKQFDIRTNHVRSVVKRVIWKHVT